DGDWPAAAEAARAYTEAYTKTNSDTPGMVAAFDVSAARPALARALAMAGDFAAAETAIDPTPRDCYPCIRTRGIIATAKKDWPQAQSWFAAAVQQAPAIPFAYFEWGEMLLAKGDADGAIAKLQVAVQKGPHFADPLEVWGEALIAKGDYA